MGRLSGSNSGGRLKGRSRDLGTVETLADIARRRGLGSEADRITEKPRLSFLQRLSKGLGAFNPAESLITGAEEGIGRGIVEYGKNVAQGLGSAVTGRDFEGERRSFSDVAEKLGVENSIAKFGIGVLGDIFLDPSTYFGGAIARGIGAGAKVAGGAGLRGIGRLAPETEAGLRLAGKGVKDALGRGFVFGYGTSGDLATRTLNLSSKLNKAKEGIVRSNLERLGTATLSKSQQDELVNKLLAGKRAEFAGASGREAAQSADPLVQKTIGEQSARSQRFAEQAGIQDPYEIYFPSLKKDNLKNFFENSRSLRVGSEGYKKEFRNLLTDEELVRNPAEAFAKREFEIVKDNLVRKELRTAIRDFGKPVDAFASEEEALKAGFKLVKEKGMFGKAVGYLPEADKKFLDNMISPEFTTIDAIARATGFDAVSALFKRSVTGLFAPFHVRNYVSGNLQNFEVLGAAALNPKNIAAGQKLAYKIAKGEKFGNDKMGKAFKAFEDRFGTSSSYIADIADATRPGRFSDSGSKFGLDKAGVIKTIKTAGLSSEGIPFKTARTIGNYIESQQKATAFITALGQGKTTKEALDLAARSGFDYRALTPFESKVLRRVIPFYSFTRKNIELQLRTLGENPQRINQIISTLENLQGGLSQEEYDKLPDYAKEQFVRKFGVNEQGLPEVSVGFGTPIEAFSVLFGSDRPTRGGFSDTIRRTAATLNPIFKLPLERAFNRDFFRDRPLDEVVEATEYAKAPEWVKDFLQATPVEKKNKDGTRRTVYNANPFRLQLLRNLPTTRGATYMSAIFGDASDTSKIFNAVTGVKPRAIDLDTVAYFRDRDQRRALEDLLIRAGVLKRFEQVYNPQ